MTAAIVAVALVAGAPRLGAQQGAQPGAVARLLDSSRVLLAKAVPAGDAAGIRVAGALLDRALTATPDDPWLLHYLGYALYREATLAMGRDGRDAGPLLERADSLLARSAALAPIAETHALRGTVLGMMIGSNPFKGMRLGPRSSEQIEVAVQLAPKNPRVWLLRGVGAINTPAMFGGGADKAEQYLKSAIELFAGDQPAVPAPSWGRHEAHVWLGQVYAKKGKPALARAEYEKALALEPGDVWTRMSLLPALDKP